MNTVGMRVNTKTNAVSQYYGLTYNSLAVMSGTLLGANESGLFKMTEDAAVTSYFETKHFDFGMSNAKRLRSARITGVLKGSLSVTSVIDGTECETVTLNSEDTVYVKTYVVNFSVDHYGRFIGLKFANVSGADFSVDSLSVFIIVTNAKWATTMCTGRVRQELWPLTISATGA